MICRSCKEKIIEGELRCHKCNAWVIDLNYFKNLDKMEEKYGTRSILELSKEKLTYPEVITILTFIQRADHHGGDGAVEDACSGNGVFSNLHRRLDEIKEESDSPFVDFRKDEFTKEEMIEIIDAYLSQKPRLDKAFGESPNFCIIMDRNYKANYRMMRKKYAKNWPIEISREKLTFSEVITLFTLVEGNSRYLIKSSSDYYEIWENLLSRFEEIKEKLLADDSVG